MLASKTLLLTGIGLSLLSAWLPYVVEGRVYSYDGLSVLTNMLDASTKDTFNIALLVPFVLLTLFYAVAFVLALNLGENSQALVTIAGALSAAFAGHLFVMVGSISVVMGQAAPAMYLHAENFELGSGSLVFVVALPCLVAGCVGCWRDVRDIEAVAGQLRLMERIQALEKASESSRTL